MPAQYFHKCAIIPVCANSGLCRSGARSHASPPRPNPASMPLQVGELVPSCLTAEGVGEGGSGWGGGLMGKLGPERTSLQHVVHILIRQALHQCAWICTSDFAGADPHSSIGMAGALLQVRVHMVHANWPACSNPG